MDDRELRYICTATGQPFPVDELDDLVETVVMDSGAEVTICRKHGSPVAVSTAGSGAGSAGELP